MKDQSGERRDEPRIEPNRDVHVALIDGNIVHPGTLIDVSISGARIRLLEPLRAGQKCVLKFNHHHQRFGCTVIWTGRNEVGIRFDDEFPQSTH